MHLTLTTKRLQRHREPPAPNNSNKKKKKSIKGIKIITCDYDMCRAVRRRRNRCCDMQQNDASSQTKRHSVAFWLLLPHFFFIPFFNCADKCAHKIDINDRKVDGLSKFTNYLYHILNTFCYKLCCCTRICNNRHFF